MPRKNTVLGSVKVADLMLPKRSTPTRTTTRPASQRAAERQRARDASAGGSAAAVLPLLRRMTSELTVCSLGRLQLAGDPQRQPAVEGDGDEQQGPRDRLV